MSWINYPKFLEVTGITNLFVFDSHIIVSIINFLSLSLFFEYSYTSIVLFLYGLKTLFTGHMSNVVSLKLFIKFIVDCCKKASMTIVVDLVFNKLTNLGYTSFFLEMFANWLSIDSISSMIIRSALEMFLIFYNESIYIITGYSFSRYIHESISK